jgi:hypothetical protein
MLPMNPSQPTSDQQPERVEFIEDSVPLQGIEQTAEELIHMYGGVVRSAEDQRIDFDLPVRRGVAASGTIPCTLTWQGDTDSEGTVRITAEREVDVPKMPQILLLMAGTAGALAFTLWPFFPAMGPVACVGAVVAFGTYLLSARRARSGIVASLLERLADAQRSIEPENQRLTTDN